MRPVLEPILARAIAAQITPGGVVGVLNHGQVVVQEAFGNLCDGEDAPVAEVGTVYDVASLTKAVVTSTVLMQLLARNKISIETVLPDLLPQFSNHRDVTVLHLAGHAAGFPAHVEFFRRLWSTTADLNARDSLLSMVAQTERTYSPGERTLYSDLGYITLGRALEVAGGARLDVLFSDLVAEPLGLRSSFFVDVAASAVAPPERVIAPTEACERRGRVRGEVHDENAHAGGGVCGHAGLFSTVPDLLSCARELCLAADGDSDVFATTPVQALWSRSAAPNTSWRLGWDSPSPTPGVTHAGDLWPRSGVGHLGFTGCSLWLDPARHRAVVILTNRVYYSREKAGIKDLRRQLMDAVVTTLDGE